MDLGLYFESEKQDNANNTTSFRRCDGKYYTISTSIFTKRLPKVEPKDYPDDEIEND